MAWGPTFDIFFVIVAANVDSERRCPHYSYAPDTVILQIFGVV